MKAKARRTLLLGVACSLAVAGVLPWPHAGQAIAGTGTIDLPCKVPGWDLLHEVVAYLYATRLEGQWVQAKVGSRSELEQHLWLYSTREISVRESCWGSSRQLAANERMVQYLILWHAPLDVVYDSDDRIQAIYTSYE